jgi:BMFP domain-containing protein YqiC
MSARYKLATLNERLTALERSLQFVEAKVKSATQTK